MALFYYRRSYVTASSVLVDAAPSVLREVCETEMKVNGLPLPNRSADTNDKEPKQLEELDVTALANHLLDTTRLTYKYDCKSFFEKLFEAAKTEFKKLPESTKNEPFLVIVPSGEEQAPPPLAEEDKVFIYRKPKKHLTTNVFKVFGTEFFLDHHQNIGPSVSVYRPTDAWISVNNLKKMRNYFGHLKSTYISSDTYHTEVLQSTRDAVEKLKYSGLITKTFAHLVCLNLDQIERGMLKYTIIDNSVVLSIQIIRKWKMQKCWRTLKRP